MSIFTQSQMKVSMIFKLVKSLFCDGNAHCAAIDDDFINVAAPSAQKLNGRQCLLDTMISPEEDVSGWKK